MSTPDHRSQMTRAQEIAIETKVLSDLQERAESLRCGDCCCREYDGLAEHIADRLHDLKFEGKRLGRVADQQRRAQRET